MNTPEVIDLIVKNNRGSNKLRRASQQRADAIKLTKLKLNARIRTRTRRKKLEKKEKKRIPFHDFFHDGGVGQSLFVMKDGIRSYLTTLDLIACGATGHLMHKICRTYTVSDLLYLRNLHLNRHQRIKLGSQAMKAVTAYQERSPKRQPRRAMIDPETNFGYWAQLYHPEDLRELHAIIDTYITTSGVSKQHKSTDVNINILDPTFEKTYEKYIPVLAAAYFVPHGKTVGKQYEVTKKLKSLIEGNGGVLKLAPPPQQFKNSVGRVTRPPETFRWWHVRLFGDPCPRHPKNLIIIVKQEDQTRLYEFKENTPVAMRVNVASS